MTTDPRSPVGPSAPPRTTRTPEATEALGEALAPALREGDVIALEGPLGAGKTRFVAGLARGLACKARVRSPSFAIVNEYHGRLLLLHLDLYRLDGRDLDGLGLEEYAERGALAVEWGEKLPGAWLREALVIAIAPAGGDERRIEAGASAGRGIELLEAWRRLAAGGEAGS
jgi:tRNA threonylcarbamoyladenosine biosynthesis protein TsaE